MSQLEKIKLGSGLTKNRTREDFRNDILIGLGAPIINIELTTDHLDQCINSALKQIWMHHRDGSFDNFYTYTITPDDASRGWMRIPENIDPDLNPEYGEIFDDETLKNLATAYAKQMWGNILRKYGGVVLTVQASHFSIIHLQCLIQLEQVRQRAL